MSNVNIFPFTSTGSVQHFIYHCKQLISTEALLGDCLYVNPWHRVRQRKIKRLLLYASMEAWILAVITVEWGIEHPWLLGAAALLAVYELLRKSKDRPASVF